MKHFIIIFLSISFFSSSIAQNDLMEVEGAIKLGDTSLNQDGAIKYDGNDIEGRVDGDWYSLTRPNAKYTEMNNLNNASYNLPNQSWTPIGPSVNVVKDRDDTVMELEFAGYLSASSINNGSGVRFELRLNGLSPDHEILASLKPADLIEFCHMRSVYKNLSAGTYVMRMYARAPNSGASANGIIIDSGGWGASIICKEQ